MLSTRILNPSEYDAWNQFVADDPRGDLLQSTAWAELKAAGGWKPAVLATADGDAIRGGVMLLERALPLGRSILYAPRGPVLDPGDEGTLGSLMAAAREYARGRRALLLKVDPPFEDPGAATALERAGFRALPATGGLGGTQPRCVMQLDLERDEDEILASFHHKWRYNIRLAGRKGVTIRQCADRAELPRFYRILQDTAKRDGFLVRGLSYFEAMWDALVPRGWMAMFLGEVEGEVVCGALSYLFGDKAWYTYGASANVHREKMPNYLMQWEMIRWARNHGCRWYDFRGVSCTPDDPDDKTAGLNRFKRGFNPRFVQYIGEFDMPLSGPGYWAFTRALPRVRAAMRRARGKEAAAETPE